MALVDGLNHLLVQVTNLDRSEAFYRFIGNVSLRHDMKDRKWLRFSSRCQSDCFEGLTVRG